MRDPPEGDGVGLLSLIIYFGRLSFELLCHTFNNEW